MQFSKNKQTINAVYRILFEIFTKFKELSVISDMQLSANPAFRNSYIVFYTELLEYGKNLSLNPLKSGLNYSCFEFALDDYFKMSEFRSDVFTIIDHNYNSSTKINTFMDIEHNCAALCEFLGKACMKLPKPHNYLTEAIDLRRIWSICITLLALVGEINSYNAFKNDLFYKK